jgi:hypothetical protein
MIELKTETKMSKVELPSRRIWNRGDYDKIRSELKNIDWENELAVRNLDDSWLFFKDSILKLTDKYFPVKVTRGPGQPRWLTKEIKNLLNCKKRHGKYSKERGDQPISSSMKMCRKK